MSAANLLNNLITQKFLADTHAHLHMTAYTGILPAVLKQGSKPDIKEVWLVGVDQASFKRNLEICGQVTNEGPALKLGIGIDPEILIPGGEFYEPELLSLSTTDLKTWALTALDEQFSEAEAAGVAVELLGEIGMDKYWLAQGREAGTVTRDAENKSWELQEALFRLQLDLAGQRHLPVSIHSRGAEAECISIVAEFKERYPELNGIFHSFTGTNEEFKAILGIDGFYIGLNGIVTYKSAIGMKDFVRNQAKLSADMSFEAALSALYESGFVLETDSPFLIPANTERGELPEIGGRRVNTPGTVWDILRSLI